MVTGKTDEKEEKYRSMIDYIIPTPKRIEREAGNTNVSIAITTAYEPWVEYVDTFCIAFEKLYDKLPARKEGGISLVCDSSQEPGSYRFDSRDGIKLSASDQEGILYAIATALQAVKVEEDRICVSRAWIEDYPDKDYRALMVDLAREWHPVFTIRNYIDICFLLKLKYLHLHFIDDQRYTLPSKAFPKLSTEGQHYSFEELKEIRRYARDRGIILIPEMKPLD